MLPSRKVSWSAFLATVREALADPKAHFFADTSFLLKAASLNGPARTIVRNWIYAIGTDRFHIPAWVAHETYRHLGKDNGQALTPMVKVAAEVAAKIEELQAEARRFVDDQSSASFPVPAGTAAPPDRTAFLLELDGEAGRLAARARHLRQKAAGRLEETADFLAELINRHVMAPGTYDRLATIEAEYAARLVGDHPPGQKDRKKEFNKYGDLLTWREIVDHCKKEPRPFCVVLLTDDNKPDWVFKPTMLVDDRGEGRPERIVSNDGNLGFRVMLPQPLLTHELTGGRQGFQLHIVSLGTLARITADRPEMRDLAHAYSAFVAEERAPPAGTPPPAQEGEAEVPPPAAISIEQRIADLSDVDRSADAVAALSAAITRGDLPAPLARAAGRAVVEAAEAGIETTELFGRGLLTSAPIHADTRPALVEGMLLGAYLREDGRLRRRPLTALIPALFEIASLAEVRPAVDRLRAEIGAEARKYLLLPGDDGAASLNMSLRRRVDGTGKLEAVLRGDVPLLVDGRRGAPASLATLADGRTEESVAGFRRLLATHFAVPDVRIETNLALADRVSWDEIQCLVDWGADTERLLR